MFVNDMNYTYMYVHKFIYIYNILNSHIDGHHIYVLYTYVLEVKKTNDIEEVRKYWHIPPRLAIANKWLVATHGKAGKSSCPVDTAFDATSLPSNTGTAVASVVWWELHSKGLRLLLLKPPPRRGPKHLYSKRKGFIVGDFHV